MARVARARYKLTRRRAEALAPEKLEAWDTEYGIPVLLGQILVGEYVYLAVLRHYQDLKSAGKRGYHFSPEHAWHIIDFVEKFFVHIKGPLAGQPILLDPWQKFWTAVLYGWRREDGGRRFITGYEEVARKNGKSTWKGPQGAYLFLMDREIGAEVYAVATTREQAMTVFKPAFDNIKKWVKRSKTAAKNFVIHQGANQEKITCDTSVFKPLPANAENLDGLNPSAILFDELHAQKSRDVWDVMISALGARFHPLLSAITTAGFVLDGICMEQRTYLIRVLRGEIQDDTCFGYIYTLDQGDDPFDEKNWKKANPGLGKSKSLEYMRAMARQAARLPSALVNFLTKDLNVWCNSADGWFDINVWDKGAAKFDPKILRGRRCWGGLDLAATTDLTAYVLVFPPDGDDPNWYILCWAWCPQDKIDTAEKDDIAAYRAWQKAGWLTGTDGAVTDYEPVKATIRQTLQEYDVQEIGFDKWNSLHVINDMQDELEKFIEIPQNTGGMYPGSKKLEELVYSKRFHHGGNPVLRHCAQNVTLLRDTNGNFRPDKKRSTGRIDLIVAAVMALSRAVLHVQEAPLDDFLNNPISG